MKRRQFMLVPVVLALGSCGGGGGDAPTSGEEAIGPDAIPSPPTTGAGPGTIASSTTSGAGQGAIASSATSVAGPEAASTSTGSFIGPGIDAVAEIKALRIPAGQYAGAYEIAPDGKLNWYFAALGLLPIVEALSAADRITYVRDYLDAYLLNLNENLGIDDVNFPAGRADPNWCIRVPSDSDDSYAATFLSLAARYVQVSGDRAWWNANAARLKDIAYRNIVLALKPSGLTSVFQAPRSAENSTGYLMDNCEVYRGLRDFAHALRTSGDAVAADYYDAIAANVAAGIGGLFVAGVAAFRAGDGFDAPEGSFYAGTTCQVFPEAFGVAECAGLFDAAWNFLNLRTPSWEDGRYDPYPWAILGFVAAQRGQFIQARAQAVQVESLFALSRARVTINELGFYQRTVNLLAGRAAI